jgi:hypothetical protein
MTRYILIIAIVGLVGGCGETQVSNPFSGSNQVQIYKADGSLQCEPFDKAQSLTDMRMELVNAGIDVVASSCGYDGLAHATVCGGATGQINIFRIPEQNLVDAEALGFANLTTLPDYQATPCP